MPPLAELLGESPAILEVRTTVRRLLERGAGARRTPPLIISGETGTGKGLLARAIHRSGPRAAGPFVDVNCAAIPETLLEAELFGFERGAFTDARQAKPGLFQAASGGTLFLDEIGLLPAPLQGKLLTVIEEQTVRRLGSTRAEPIDVAVIAATGEDLVEAVRARRFREDLYHRLGVLTLRLPALRERDSDVLLLADHFLARACAEYGVGPKRLMPQARTALLRHPWPGNVRELVNLMERVVLLSEGPLITADALGLAPLSSPDAPGPAHPDAPPLLDALQALERDRCLAALQDASWNLSRAAASLGLPRNTLRYRIEKYRLQSRGDPATARPRHGQADRAAPPATAVTGPTSGRRPLVHWQRRHVAFLRVVISPLPGAELPADAHRWLAALAEKAESFGGRVAELGPKGLLTTFGVESAEDAARRAAHAALAMTRAAARAAEASRARGSLTIGIHVDQALVGETGGEAILDADAKLAAWSLLETLVAHGRPNAIVISKAASPFLDRGFELEPLGPGGGAPPLLHELRGLERTGYGLGGRPLSPFVGRGGELALVAERLAAAETGPGHAVGIMGEPGVGKSRLIYECTRVARGRGYRALQCRGVSHGKATPYGPIVELLRTYFEIEDRDLAADIRAKVGRALPSREEAFFAARPALLSLLDVPVDEPAWHVLEPPQRRERTQQAVEHLLLQEARSQPLVLVVEDLQWIDSETQALLDRLVGRVAAAPLLVLVSYRPEYEHGWAAKASCTQLRLDPLSRQSSGELLRTMLGEDASLVPLRELLIERTGGNPFFLEESVRALVETGVLVGERGACAVATDLKDIQVPPSVHAVLEARIQRLPAAGQGALRTAAVAGRHVPLALLRRIVDEPADTLERSLAELQAAEFLYETSLAGEPEYTFKHALTHEVAYGSVLPDERRELHRRIVGALEELHPDRVVEHAEILAHHALRAELWDAAGRHLRQAGTKAIARSAYREAVGFYEQTLAALARLPQTKAVASDALDVRIALGPPLIATRGAGSPDVEASYRAAQELCHRLGETRRLFPILWGRWYVTHNRGQYEQAARLGEQLLGVARRADDRALLVEAHHSTWSTLFAMGHPREAEAHCREGIALYDPSLHHSSVLLYGGHDPGMCAHGIRSAVLWELGYPDQARQQSEDALRLTTHLAHPMSTAILLYGLARLHYLLGDLQSATRLAEEAVALGRAHGIAVWVDQASMLVGRLLVQAGHREEGLRQLHTARRGATAHGWTWGAVFSAAVFAASCLDVGHLDEGLAMLDAVDSRQVERLHEPELQRLRGELLLARTPAATHEAAACFQRAIEVARRRQARSLELRAAMSLSRLQHRQGARDEARQTLTGIYGWFTEGHDTADLTEAWRLLDELS